MFTEAGLQEKARPSAGGDHDAKMSAGGVMGRHVGREAWQSSLGEMGGGGGGG